MRVLVRVAIASILFFVITVFKTYPLILHFNTHIPSDPGDPLLNVWILAWDFHALTTDPGNLFNANIFYPVENTLAFSEHMVGVLPIFAPAYAMTGNPIFAYNVAFVLSFILSGVAMFLLIHYWTQSFWASLVSGVLFAFSPIRFRSIPHLQVLNLFWAPVALLFLDRFLRGKRWGDLAGFAIFYWLQVLSSLYLGWFITIAVALYVSYYALFIDRSPFNRSVISRYATFVALSLLILLPFHLPYYKAKQQWGLFRSLRECVSLSADLFYSYLSVHPLMNDLYLSVFQFVESSYTGNSKHFLPGFVLPILVVIGSFSVSKLLPSDKAVQMKRVFWIILVTSFILSLGPYLLIFNKNTHIPLPYILLYHWVPGFKAMRFPARFGLMAILAASVLTALGFLKACDYLNTRAGLTKAAAPAGQAVLASFILGLFALELGFKPLPLVRLQTGREVPEVYRWLAGKNLNGPIVELPFGTDEKFQLMYFSTYHWLPIVNGWSGFVPPTYFQIAHELQALPSRWALEYLSAIGVKGLVLHTDRLQPREALLWHQADLGEMGLERAAQFGPDIVYKISPVESTRQLALTFAVPDRLPAGVEVRIGLLAQGIGARLWAHPRPPGRISAIVEWEEQRTGKISIQREKLELPLVIRAEEASPKGLPVRTPSSPGGYTLRLRLPSFEVSTAPKVVELVTPPFGPVLTSLNSPELLAASYVLQREPALEITSEPVHISLKVVNSGAAVWLANAEGDRGAVRLGWRWFKGGQYVLSTEGREVLHYDVFPGQQYEFSLTMTAPKEPGQYTLVLGMVNEKVNWFSDLGVKPVKIAVRVISGSAGFEH